METSYSGFVNSSYPPNNLEMRKELEQYYTYFKLLNDSYDNYVKENNKKVKDLEDHLSYIHNKLDFIEWYYSKSWFRRFIWKLKKLNYEQLKYIKENGI